MFRWSDPVPSLALAAEYLKKAVKRCVFWPPPIDASYRIRFEITGARRRSLQRILFAAGAQIEVDRYTRGVGPFRRSDRQRDGGGSRRRQRIHHGLGARLRERIVSLGGTSCAST